MGIARPDLILDPSPAQHPVEGVHCPREHEHDHEREPARERTREAQLVPVDAVAPLAELDPAARPTAVARTRQVSAGWLAEAGATARAGLDGSVWRARPAALRDIHARTQRGEWAGDSATLLLAGQVYGYVALPLIAVLYGAAEVVKRPLRLLAAALIVLALVLAL